jgi:hypothetical protein
MDVSRILQVTHMALKQCSERERMVHEDELSRTIRAALDNEARLLKKYEAMTQQLFWFESEFASISRQMNEMKRNNSHDYDNGDMCAHASNRTSSSKKSSSSCKKMGKNDTNENSTMPSKPYLDFGCIDDNEEDDGDFVDESLYKSMNKTQETPHLNGQRQEEDIDHTTPLLTRNRHDEEMLPPSTTSTIKDRQTGSSDNKKRGWTSDRDRDASVIENGNKNRKSSRVSDFPLPPANTTNGTGAQNENAPNVCPAITPAPSINKPITAISVEDRGNIAPKAPQMPPIDKQTAGGKYNEVVRNKADRAQLPGHTCKDCLDFYQALVDQVHIPPLLPLCFLNLSVSSSPKNHASSTLPNP